MEGGAAPRNAKLAKPWQLPSKYLSKVSLILKEPTSSPITTCTQKVYPPERYIEFSRPENAKTAKLAKNLRSRFPCAYFLRLGLHTSRT